MGLDVSVGGALVAGLLSFLSPCVLPMVPFYLSYMAGLSVAELRGEGGLAPGATRRLTLAAVAFALGVTTIFVLLGLGATAVGSAFRAWQDRLAWVAAAILILFGLHFLGVLRIPLLHREARIAARTNPASLAGAYLTGLAFGFGWTPCVGPALAAILMLASMQDSLLRGGLLLFVYGAGMTAPFVLAALFARPFLAWIGRNMRLVRWVEKAMGLLLILFAVLIVTGNVSVIAQWMIDHLPWLTTLG